MDYVAIIPARGGSKGVPRKNILSIAGKPLVAYSIEQALSSPSISEVFVTTDCADIARVSRDFGATVLDRPSYLGSDTASSESALEHALDAISSQRGELPQSVVFLQCTSPVRMEGDIESAICKFKDSGADSLLSVTESHRFFWRDEDGLCPINYEMNRRPRRQDRTPELMENGSIYIFRSEQFLKEKNRLFGKIAPYAMNAGSAYEIDTEEDFVVVEAIIRHWRKLGYMS